MLCLVIFLESSVDCFCISSFGINNPHHIRIQCCAHSSQNHLEYRSVSVGRNESCSGILRMSIEERWCATETTKFFMPIQITKLNCLGLTSLETLGWSKDTLRKDSKHWDTCPTALLIDLLEMKFFDNRQNGHTSAQTLTSSQNWNSLSSDSLCFHNKKSKHSNFLSLFFWTLISWMDTADSRRQPVEMSLIICLNTRMNVLIVSSSNVPGPSITSPSILSPNVASDKPNSSAYQYWRILHHLDSCI